jgi:glycosyltransferase involved in cell wall biosynthesis
MRILIVDNSHIPVHLYGGTERVIWSLGKELVMMGHEVSFMVKKGSHCGFAEVIHMDESVPLFDQIPKNFDVVHFNFQPPDTSFLEIPYIVTMHGNTNNQNELDVNTVFVSRNHALRFGSDSFVYNGLDWSAYSVPDFNLKRNYFHFLGNAAWRVKNVSGAIRVVKNTKHEKLKVLGGLRFNFKMGMRFTFSPRITFAGMVGGNEKFSLLNGSKGLIFPVKWHEPFGLAIIESLYYGCPVFGTPYGSLPELVSDKFGYLSNKADELTNAILNADQYSPINCHEYARDEFNSHKMALGYLTKYEQVISGIPLNPKRPKLMEIQEKKWLDWN